MASVGTTVIERRGNSPADRLAGVFARVLSNEADRQDKRAQATEQQRRIQEAREFERQLIEEKRAFDERQAQTVRIFQAAEAQKDRLAAAARTKEQTDARRFSAERGAEATVTAAALRNRRAGDSTRNQTIQAFRLMLNDSAKLLSGPNAIAIPEEERAEILRRREAIERAYGMLLQDPNLEFVDFTEFLPQPEPEPDPSTDPDSAILNDEFGDAGANAGPGFFSRALDFLFKPGGIEESLGRSRAEERARLERLLSIAEESGTDADVSSIVKRLRALQGDNSTGNISGR